MQPGNLSPGASIPPTPIVIMLKGQRRSQYQFFFSTLLPVLLFPEKEAKSVVPLRGALNRPTNVYEHCSTSALQSHNHDGSLLTVLLCFDTNSSFSRKRSKKRCSASRKSEQTCNALLALFYLSLAESPPRQQSANSVALL
jgi:hypothetical protein